MLKLLASSNTIAVGSKLLVEAVDGISPYVYSLVTDGDGGDVTANGEYTAPLDNKIGSQEILVTDNSGATATVEIFILNYLQFVAMIISKSLELEPDQAYIYNQKIDIPKDNRMFIAIGVSSVKTFASNMKVIDGVEYSYTSNQATLKIDVMSKSLEAFNRKEEVISSLTSVLSRRTQTQNMFKIARLPSSFTDLSNIDGSAIPYRYNISVNILYSMRKSKTIDYYDGDTVKIDTIELNDDGVIADSSEARI